MKFFGYFRSSAAFRVRIAFNLKGVTPDETAFIHLRRGEHSAPGYLATNPQGLVPALVLDDGSVLGQSLAIMEYLEETHPEPPLLPRDPAGRARVRAMAMICACEIHPLQNMRVLAYVRANYGLDEAGSFAWARHWNEVGLAAFERSLAGHPSTGRFTHGDRPGLADACLVPQVFSAQRFSVDLAAYPTVMRIHQACMALPAFELAQPAKQPDAEP
jgi:maleylacetoacetate isomerase